MSRHADQHGGFEITSFPGQSQIGVCHAFFISQAQRGGGRAHVLKSEQRKALKHLQYDCGLATVAAGNIAQKRVLAKAGWTKVFEFYNRRSCEITEIWGHAL